MPLNLFNTAECPMLNESTVNILLVDDHPENLIALEAILEGLGQNLVKAQSGTEALKCLLNQDFAVILLDVQMPGMDGFETATLIRQRERSRSTPIIFLTAFNTSDSFVFKGYSLRAVDYLLKPIQPEILVSKVEVFVDLYQKTLALKQQTDQLVATNRKLKRSEEKFRSLSACSPIGIFLTDVAGRCTYTNPRCQAICGFAIEESLDSGWKRFVHPADQERVTHSWRKYLAGQEGFSTEYRLQPQADTLRWVSVRSSPMFSDGGELIGYVGTVEDVSDRKQAEETQFQLIREQIARQEAEAINRMKDEFLAVLSHELRTPLNSILGWAKLLRMHPLDPDKTTRALETIERNAKLQSDLIADILDVSRIVQGKLQINCVLLSVASVLNAALDAATPLAIAKSIAIEAHIDPTVPPIMADANRIQQVVWNLLSNAIKFTPTGGKIELRLQRVDDWAQIQVTDTGIGISPEFIPYMFDRFRQADSSMTRGHGGLGLGLAIVRHLVELHRGTIAVESPGEGKGATFKISLPLSSAASQPAPPTFRSHSSSETVAAVPCEPSSSTSALPEEPMQDDALQGVRLLVVEDDADAREYLQFVLEEAGASVTMLDSPHRALTTVAEQPFDLLISDIGMEEEDGYSFIRKVRNLEVGKDLPAIALTAYAGEVDKQRALTAGFQLHLAKPVKPDELIFTVCQLIQRQS
jgi:PAS domain S-box-containing protein